MVERAPVPTITIRGLGTVSALRTNADMYEMLGEQLHHIAIRLIIEIAHHQYQRVGMKSLDGVYRLYDTLCHQLPAVIGTAPTPSTGGVQYHDVQGVAALNLTLHIQHVAHGGAVGCLHTQGVVPDWAEQEGRIEQRHIHTSRVVAVGHQPFIVSLTQSRAPTQVTHHTVILHLGECHESRQLPGGSAVSALSAGDDSLGEQRQFPPVAR